ncbi:MAG TPA: peptidoglycan-binding domain-containing protein [Gaiellaceae bacterium]|nr:peptidoglycan-binding domain-containing protein [Gaiellaceae bacterium]
MAGRDKGRGWDPDDWFGGPEPPGARRARPHEARPRANVSPAPPARDHDRLGGSDAWPSDGLRLGSLGRLSEPRRAIAAGVALIVLLGLGLQLSGAFSSATPHRTTTATVTTHATTPAAPSKPQPTPTAAPSGPLKPGDQGAEVKVLQRALASRGYPPGTVDGIYGPLTRRAVTRFQRSSKLAPDGIVGSQTLLALQAARTGP